MNIDTTFMQKLIIVQVAGSTIYFVEILFLNYQTTEENI